jgi:arylsulfatase A-like enzyme
MAKASGYHTSYFGKLGMGYSENHELIKLYGFDHYVGLYDSVVCWSFYPEFYWNNGKKITLPNNPKFNKNSPQCPLIGEPNMTYTEDIWLKEALNYIDEKKNSPFFMIYSTQLPHGPASIAPKDHVFRNKKDWTEKERVYASMISKMDKSLGSIVQKLKDHKIDKNTVIIFTGDNGHEPSYYADLRQKSNNDNKFWDGHQRSEDIFQGSLGKRGMKRWNFEGGLRVPTIVKWSGKVKATSQSELNVATYDLFATCADIMNCQTEFKTDGISFKNELLGLPQQEHNFLYWQNSTGASRDALLKNNWKIVQEKDIENKKRLYKWALYDIQKDPLETTDLSNRHPEKLQDLIKLIPRKGQ